MARRSRAREVVLQVLFQQDLNRDTSVDRAREFVYGRLREPRLADFAWLLYCGVMEHRKLLDARIEETAKNWSLKRMAVTDRNVLRLGAFELLYTETPSKVAVDEALELAKRYGSAQSSQFVNGILDRLMPHASPLPPPADPTQPPEVDTTG